MSPRDLLGSPGRLALAILALVANVGFYLPDAPSSVGGVSLGGLDKLYHAGVFALTIWALGRLLAPVRRFPMGWVVLAGALHAVLIELVQGALLPHRSADAADVLADLVGVALGVLIWWAERHLARRGSPLPR